MTAALEILQSTAQILYNQTKVLFDGNYHTDKCFLEDVTYIPLQEKVLKFGRTTGDVIVKSPVVSATHFIIWQMKFSDCSPVIFYLKDVSLNGTLVNGNLVGKNLICMLNHNDFVTLNLAFKFRFLQVSDPFSSCCPSAVIDSINHIEYLDWKVSPKVIGHGSFGMVYLATNRTNKTKPFAVKITRNKVTVDLMPRIKREAEILLEVDHVRLYQQLIYGVAY